MMVVNETIHHHLCTWRRFGSDLIKKYRHIYPATPYFSLPHSFFISRMRNQNTDRVWWRGRVWWEKVFSPFGVFFFLSVRSHFAFWSLFSLFISTILFCLTTFALPESKWGNKPARARILEPLDHESSSISTGRQGQWLTVASIMTRTNKMSPKKLASPGIHCFIWHFAFSHFHHIFGCLVANHPKEKNDHEDTASAIALRLRRVNSSSAFRRRGGGAKTKNCRHASPDKKFEWY